MIRALMFAAVRATYERSTGRPWTSRVSTAEEGILLAGKAYADRLAGYTNAELIASGEAIRATLRAEAIQAARRLEAVR